VLYIVDTNGVQFHNPTPLNWTEMFGFMGRVRLYQLVGECKGLAARWGNWEEYRFFKGIESLCQNALGVK
jgi:hypothetical protein